MDQEEDQQSGFFSALSSLHPLLLIHWIRRLAFAIISISLGGFILLTSIYRPFACILLLVALIHYLTFFPDRIVSRAKKEYGWSWFYVARTASVCLIETFYRQEHEGSQRFFTPELKEKVVFLDLDLVLNLNH
ncbi:hypothetical protein [Algoriphagus boritolerans]|uniref:hypothetical protein n=1 Tax=Algoriphagus boritolerans TaxID=308111 RepID=UPI002FCDE4A8